VNELRLSVTTPESPYRRRNRDAIVIKCFNVTLHYILLMGYFVDAKRMKIFLEMIFEMIVTSLMVWIRVCKGPYVKGLLSKRMLLGGDNWDKTEPRRQGLAGGL
jgi:hypothetical protein